MLKKIILRKIMVASTMVLVLLMLYFIPLKSNEIDLNKKAQVEYIYPNDLEAIYLLDTNNNLTRSMISVNKENELTKAKSLIEELTINSNKSDIIPKGFKSLIPKDTKVNNLTLENKVLKIDFSKEFLNVSPNNEEKLLESLIYTLTSIDGIDKIIIYVDNKKLEYLPHSHIKLPEFFDKSYGINKKYELATINNIDSYTVYYVFNCNNDTYYTPVTKYINNENQDKVRIIIDELATSLLYESNLMSYLDNNVKLLDYEITDKVIKLNFNEFILSDITDSLILEEVMYTIGLSLCDEFNLEEVIFSVNNREISTFSLKMLD